MLEKQIGAKVPYKLLETFWVPGMYFGDIIKIQGAAKEIADFVGLSGFTFVVSLAKQRENVAGQVELKYSGNNVFVEISGDMRNFEDALIATLAHEITHKYVQINGISAGTELAHQYENEVLTDITSVFLGLGKLMLNGAEEEKTHQEIKANGTHYITETRRCGYLNRQQLAFVYRLVCGMRGISKKDMMCNLSTGAKNAVLFCDREYREYFDPKFRSDSVRNESISQAMKDIEKGVSKLGCANELLAFMEKECIQRTRTFLEAKRDKINAMKHDLDAFGQSDIYDPCLKFLSSIQLKERATQVRREAKQENLDIAKMIKKSAKLKAKIRKQRYLRAE